MLSPSPTFHITQILRKDGAAWDLGYVRTAQRPDGRIVTVYYFPEEQFTERIIAATIWDPGVRKK
jgi:hypothetical protein